MPELPEVETVVRSLQAVRGWRILNIESSQPRVAPGDLRGAVDKRIRSITRRGKFILVALEPAGYLMVHLGMTGKLLINGPVSKHSHVIVTLDRGSLVYTDSRQFGRVEYSESPPARVGRLGPEPLEINFEEFAASLRARRSMMKTLLLNQRFLAGVGNIYADEALFRARIHPRASSARLSAKRARLLYDALRDVLVAAIAAKGSSISDYVDSEGHPGSFQHEHLAYRRTGEPCSRCGSIIRRILVSQRGTHYCPKCQK